MGPLRVWGPCMIAHFACLVTLFRSTLFPAYFTSNPAGPLANDTHIPMRSLTDLDTLSLWEHWRNVSICPQAHCTLKLDSPGIFPGVHSKNFADQSRCSSGAVAPPRCCLLPHVITLRLSVALSHWGHSARSPAPWQLQRTGKLISDINKRHVNKKSSLD